MAKLLFLAIALSKINKISKFLFHSTEGIKGCRMIPNSTFLHQILVSYGKKTLETQTAVAAKHHVWQPFHLVQREHFDPLQLNGTFQGLPLVHCLLRVHHSVRLHP